MQPEQPHAVIDGENVQLQNTPTVQPSKPKLVTFIIKYVLLVVVVYALIQIAYLIVFVGLLPVSLVLGLLALLLLKEVYSDLRRQLDSSSQSLLFTAVTLVPVLGPLCVLFYVIARRKQSTS